MSLSKYVNIPRRSWSSLISDVLLLPRRKAPWLPAVTWKECVPSLLLDDPVCEEAQAVKLDTLKRFPDHFGVLC